MRPSISAHRHRCCICHRREAQFCHGKCRKPYFAIVCTGCEGYMGDQLDLRAVSQEATGGAAVGSDPLVAHDPEDHR